MEKSRAVAFKESLHEEDGKLGRWLKEKGSVWPEKVKKALLATVIFSLFLSSILLAYENSLLHGDVEALSGKLSAQTSKLEALEGRYEKLLKEHERLLGECETLNSSYSALMQNFTRLMAEYVELTVAYARLNATYMQLLANYTVLQQEVADYPALQQRYEALLGEYQALQANYSALKSEYEAAYFALYEPLLSNETVTPTISELEEWLAEDKTNELQYVEWDFVCGDYAVMLSMHAKMKHWDMGVVAVLGYDSNGKEFDHAFNAIRCKEGLVYVEPQNDHVFYGPISEGSWYEHPGFGEIYVETFIIVVLYQPPF